MKKVKKNKKQDRIGSESYGGSGSPSYSYESAEETAVGDAPEQENAVDEPSDHLRQEDVPEPLEEERMEKQKNPEAKSRGRRRREYNSPKQLFWRAFASTFGVLCCGLAVVIGILVADARTHQTAGAEEYHSFLLEAEEHSFSVTFLGSKMTFDLAPLERAAEAAEPLQDLVPPEYRLASSGFQALCDWMCGWISSLIEAISL